MRRLEQNDMRWLADLIHARPEAYQVVYGAGAVTSYGSDGFMNLTIMQIAQNPRERFAAWNAAGKSYGEFTREGIIKFLTRKSNIKRERKVR